jgi:hypothetical protein
VRRHWNGTLAAAAAARSKIWQPYWSAKIRRVSDITATVYAVAAATDSRTGSSDKWAHLAVEAIDLTSQEWWAVFWTQFQLRKG